MKKMMIGIMTLVAGASLFAAGPNFVDKNGDGVCDTYVNRGNKTVYEAGVKGAGQYRNNQTKMIQRQRGGHTRFREEAPGQGRNRNQS